MSISYKHLQGQHNQKTHGNRYGRTPQNKTIPISKRVEFYEAQDGIYKVMGYNKANGAQISEFKRSIDELHPKIQSLMQGDYTPLVLAENPAWDFYWGMSQSNWVVLSSKSFDGSIARHEFVHYIVGGGKIGASLSTYNPSWKFKHASDNPDERGKINEDLTITIGAYSTDKQKWAKNIMEIETGIIPEMASQKVAEAESFLQGLGLW